MSRSAHRRRRRSRRKAYVLRLALSYGTGLTSGNRGITNLWDHSGTQEQDASPQRNRKQWCDQAGETVHLTQHGGNQETCRLTPGHLKWQKAFPYIDLPITIHDYDSTVNMLTKRVSLVRLLAIEFGDCRSYNFYRSTKVWCTTLLLLYVRKSLHTQAYLRFLQHEATRSISTPPTPPPKPWMGSQSNAGLPPTLNSPVPIYTPECREALWE